MLGLLVVALYRTGRFGPALPFMIDWGDSSHPTDSLPAAVRLVGLEVTHPDADTLRLVYDIIGITTDVELRNGPQPSLRATIVAEAAEITLSS